MELSVIERVKKVREDEKMSQKEFSEALGVSLGYIGGVETGRNPINHTFLTSLKEKFNISADWLLFGEEQKEDIEEIFRLALILDSSDMEILKAIMAISDLLECSSDPEDLNSARILQESGFHDRHRNAVQLGEMKAKLHRVILNELHVKNTPLKEMNNIIKVYIDTSVRSHNHVQELVDDYHEMLYAEELPPKK